MASEEPADSLAGLGEFAVIDRLVAGRDQPAVGRRGPRRRRRGRRRGRTAGRWCPPTCSSKADTSGWTGRRRTTWAARPSRRTPPTSRPWAPRQPRSSSRSAHPVTPPPRRRWNSPTACGRRPGGCGAGIVGGDLVSAPQWVISVTVLGDLAGRAPVLRAGARAGDTLAVAGELGRSAAGYHLWHNDIDGFDVLRRRHLVPEPPYGQGRVAADGGATAMTDVSDGLVADLRPYRRGVRRRHQRVHRGADGRPRRRCRGRRRSGRRPVGMGARRRRGPCPRRDVPRHTAATAGGPSARCSTGRRGCWSTATTGTEIRAGSRFSEPSR